MEPGNETVGDSPAQLHTSVCWQPLVGEDTRLHCTLLPATSFKRGKFCYGFSVLMVDTE